MMGWAGGPGKFAPRDPRATLRRIVKSFAPYRRQVVLVLAAVFVSSLLGLLSPFFLRAMVVLDWRLTLLAVGVMPIFAVIGARVGMFARNVQQRSQEKMADMNAITQETLSVSGALLTKTSGRGELTMERFARENEGLT